MFAIQEIEETTDLVAKALKLAAVITELFAQEGCELVVVGGSAVEFYTEGAYMSGDIDFCRNSLKRVSLRRAQELMGSIGAKGGPRSWQVAGLYVDMLGFLENESNSPLRAINTSLGPVKLIPPELVLVERTLQSYYPCPDEEAKSVAKKMLAVCLTGQTEVDWDEVDRLAGLPDFKIQREMRQLRREVEDELRQ